MRFVRAARSVTLQFGYCVPHRVDVKRPPASRAAVQAKVSTAITAAQCG